MKHLLNNISDDEKKSILEQHKGGMKVYNEKFNAFVNKRLGEVNLFEQESNFKPDLTTFSSKKISELPQEIKNKFIESELNSNDFISYEQTGSMQFNDINKAKYLFTLVRWSIETALKMENKTMDEAINIIASQPYLTQTSKAILATQPQKSQYGNETPEEKLKIAFSQFSPETLSKVILDNYDRLKRLITSKKY